MLTTRQHALHALHEIEEKGRRPKAVLEQLSESLNSRERSFLMELVYGVLRYRVTLDWTLKGFLKKPSGLGIDTLNNLRLGVYQILFLRVPDWAAVHEAVELEKKQGRPDVVNGVLRNLLRKPPEDRLCFDGIKKKGPVPYLSVLTSHPEWLIRRWISRFGVREAQELAEANNRIPPLTLRVNTLRSSREEIIRKLQQMGITGEPTQFSPDGIKLKTFHLFKELSILKDSLVVQDEASQLVAYLLEPQQGEKVLDACAAPGGKTTHIAQIMRDRGDVIASDIDEKRIALLRNTISTLGISSATIICSDIGAYKGDGGFDRILLDAPCSSLGVIRRNPDVKYRYSRRDLSGFKAKQISMIHAASKLLRPGGIMVYSVCSTEPEEGEEVIKEFLKDSRNFYIIDTTLPFLREFMKSGFLRTYPHKHDMDGFFGAKLCKKD